MIGNFLNIVNKIILIAIFNFTGANLKQLSFEQSLRAPVKTKIPMVSNFRLPAYNSGHPFIDIYAQMYHSLVLLSEDPYPKVSELAGRIIDSINQFKREHQKSYFGDSKEINVDIPYSPKLDSNQFHPKNFVKNEIGPIPSAFYPPNKFKIDPMKNLDSFEEGHQFDFKDVTTDFFNWSSKYFTQPLLPFHKLTQQPTHDSISSHEPIKSITSYSIGNKLKSFDKVSYKRLPNLIINEPHSKPPTRCLMHVIDSAKYEDRNELMRKQNAIKKEGSQNWTSCLSSGSTQLSQVFLQKIDSKPELLKFHPYLNYLAVVDRGGVSLWNWESGQRAQYMLSQSVSYKDEMDMELDCGSYITSLEFLNAEEDRGGLILVGTMDGKVKIWRNYLRDMGQDPDIVTSWIALQDQLISNRPSGLISHWSQSLGQLTLSGDVKYIRLWDSVQECKIIDMNTNSESCVTTVDRSLDGRIVIAGFGDGNVKLFDTRVPSSSNEYTFNTPAQRDTGWIHKVAISEATSQVYSIGVYGEMTTWSLKQRSSQKVWNTPSRRSTPIKKDPDPENISYKVVNREGLTKDQFAPDTKITLAKSHKHTLKYQPIHCADFRVSSVSEIEHLAVVGYGKESHGILTATASMGSINSNFKFFEGFSRANIDKPTSVCVHPYQTLVGAGLEDSNLLLLKLQQKL